MQLKIALVFSLAALFSLSRSSFSMERKAPFTPIIQNNDLLPLKIIAQLQNGDPFTISQEKIIVEFKDKNKPNMCLSHNNFAICCVAYKPTSDKIITGSKDATIVIWNTETGKKDKILKGHKDAIYEVSYTKDGNNIVSCSHDRTIKKWNPHNGSCLGTFNGHTGPVFCFSYKKNTFLVSGSEDKTIKIWNMDTYKCISTLIGHKARVLSVKCKDDTIISGSYDNTIKIWSATTKSCLHTLHGHTDPIWIIELGHHNQIFAGDYNGKTITWLPDVLVKKMHLHRLYFSLFITILLSNEKNYTPTKKENLLRSLRDKLMSYENEHTITQIPEVSSPIKSCTYHAERFIQ